MRLPFDRRSLRAGVGMLLGVAFITGCGGKNAPAPSGDSTAASQATSAAKPSHDDHGHSHDGGGHGHSHDGGAHAHVLKATVEEGELVAGKPVSLALTIRDEEGQLVTKYEVIHEHPLHLMAVREGLDQFLHLHPTVDASGVGSASIVFPAAGKWFLFADHSIAGHGEATAKTTLEVAGDAAPAAPLVVNAPGKVMADGAPIGAVALAAEVKIAPDPSNKDAKITFDLIGADDQPVSGLQKHLGAAGHLVIVSADGKQYAHAHPLQTEAASHVEFDAHLAGPGLYKGWAQFKQSDVVYTLPFVFTIAAEAKK